MTIKLQRLGHILVNVRDIERSKAFYTGILGFTVLEQDLAGEDIQNFQDARRRAIVEARRGESAAVGTECQTEDDLGEKSGKGPQPKPANRIPDLQIGA